MPYESGYVIKMYHLRLLTRDSISWVSTTEAASSADCAEIGDWDKDVVRGEDEDDIASLEA